MDWENGVEIIVDTDDGGVYDWDVTALVRRHNGDVYEYAIYEDSGCSCNWAYEMEPEYYDLSWELDPFTLISRLGLSVNDRVEFRQALEESLK